MSSIAGQTVGRSVKSNAPAAGSFRRSRFFTKDFYFVMSLVIAAVIVAGFSRTVPQRLFHPNPAPPRIIYLHGAVFSGWVLFFILQSALVRTRNVKIHRTLGWFGVALGSFIPILGVATTIAMFRFEVYTRHDLGKLPFIDIPLNDMLCFTPAFALAVYWRKKPEFHRRLMFVASCFLTAAAFGRLVDGPFVYASVDLLILCGVARDWIADRRVNIVYRYALPIAIALQAATVATYLHNPPWYQSFAQPLVK